VYLLQQKSEEINIKRGYVITMSQTKPGVQCVDFTLVENDLEFVFSPLQAS
jgi:hypothetical protein